MYGATNKNSIHVAVIIIDLFYACNLSARSYTEQSNILQVFFKQGNIKDV